MEERDYVQAWENFWGATAEVIKLSLLIEVNVGSHHEIHRYNYAE